MEKYFPLGVAASYTGSWGLVLSCVVTVGACVFEVVSGGHFGDAPPLILLRNVLGDSVLQGHR